MEPMNEQQPMTTLLPQEQVLRVSVDAIALGLSMASAAVGYGSGHYVPYRY